MMYELEEISDKVKALFSGIEETLVYSCLEKVMGKVYVTDKNNPVSAFAFVGCFGFFAGKPDKELVMNKPEGFVIMVPQNEEWAELIEQCYKDSKRTVRYAIRKDTVFDKDYLESIVKMLPDGYTMKKIDGEIYDKCLTTPVTRDFVSCFYGKEDYLRRGRGVVILKNGEIVSGASSYTRYKGGIEIEVDTMPEERRQHLALIVSARLILNCLEENLYPSWDAQNMNSVRLAEKLGYQFSHEYVAYEVSSDARPH